MCGIVGIFNLNGEQESPVILKKMVDKIHHRGPDSEGIFIDGFIALGHKRLSILDLSNLAHQPMYSQNKKFVLVYNGELYNYKEIRKELISYGYSFKSNSDTEVVLYSYIHWKEKCLDKFNGMFAFAIWDYENYELFLARDRYGIKPLYYYYKDHKFIFASEYKAILETNYLKKELDYEAFIEYFTFQNFFTDKVLNKNIKILKPGKYIKLPLGYNKKEIKINEYWDFNFESKPEFKTEKEYLEKIDDLFQQAVKSQLISDVEVGAYLSGGLDSASVTAISSTNLPYIKTFTCGFDLSNASNMELAYDERKLSEIISSLYRTEHYEVVLKTGDMDRILDDLVYHVEEPRVGQSYPNFYISRLASKFVKVILSGIGSDELFCGYPWRYYRTMKKNSFDEYIDNYYSVWQRLLPIENFENIFSPIWKNVKDVDLKGIFKGVFKKDFETLNSYEDYINHSLYFEAKTFLHGILVVEDKISMSNSLETRVPFLDNEFVDFAMKMPVKYKLKKAENYIKIDENEKNNKRELYFKKTNDGKNILRKMLKKYFPYKITNNKKQGFVAPNSSWNEVYIKELLERLKNKSNVIYNFFNYNEIEKLLNEHIKGKSNRRLLIWSLLYFEKWCKFYL